MKHMRTFKITFDDRGRAEIRVKGAKGNRDSRALESITEQLANALGDVEERHIGEWKGGVHTHDGGKTYHSHGDHQHLGGAQ